MPCLCQTLFYFELAPKPILVINKLLFYDGQVKIGWETKIDRSNDDLRGPDFPTDFSIGSTYYKNKLPFDELLLAFSFWEYKVVGVSNSNAVSSRIFIANLPRM